MKSFVWADAHPSLAAIPTRRIVLWAIWMGLWYAVWLWLRVSFGETYSLTRVAVACGFLPLLLCAVLDFRQGLLLSIVAAPLLIAPIIPHWFTQGFGDLFAVCSVVGYVARHPRPWEWSRLWRRGYFWLVLALAAAILSLVFSPKLSARALYGTKYGIAEIAGYCLAMSYFLVLAHEIRSKQDIRQALTAAMSAIAIVICFGLASSVSAAGCVGGYSSILTLTVNQGVTATFGNPDYQAAYIVVILPLVLFICLTKEGNKTAQYIAGAIALLLIFFVQASLSRAGLLGLIVIWLGWAAVSRWKSGARGLGVTMALALLVTPLIWQYPACSCSDAPVGTCLIKNRATGSRGIHESTYIDHIFSYSAKGGWTDKIRLQLIDNALVAWRGHPITGVGIGLLQNYSVANEQPNRAHNVLLTIMAEQGVLGLAAWLGWWLFLASVLWSQRKKIAERGHPLAFIAIAFAVVTLQSMFMDQLRIIWIWQVAALVVALPRALENDANAQKHGLSK